MGDASLPFTSMPTDETDPGDMNNSLVTEGDAAPTPSPSAQPINAAAAHESLQSVYPGIEDYDALLLQQLRYRFQEHESGLAWKAMQRAGWSYKSKGYVAPGGTRVFGHQINELRALLDEPAVETLQSNLQKDPGVDEMEVEEQEDGKEGIKDLRNTIIYHMQKLIEESKRKSSSNKNGTTSGSKSTSKEMSRKDDDDDDDDDDSDSADDDDKDQDTKPAAVRPRRSKRHSSTTAATAATTNKSVTATEKGTDLYLHRKSKGRKSKAPPPSSTDISTEDLSFPTLDECKERMRAFDTSVCDKIETYYREHCFASWRHLLSTNHSLILYGNGSKHTLLSDFCERELQLEGYALQIDGFHPDVTVDGILDLLVTMFLDGVEPPATVGLFLRQTAQKHFAVEDVPDPYNFQTRTTVERAVTVARALAQHCAETTRTPIFLVVHSLDGLRTERAQDALAALVQHGVPGGSDVAALRLVASLDHVDASAALWSSATTTKFRWIWKEVHTHRPYIEELALLGNDEDALLTGNKKRSARSKKLSMATKQEANALQVLKNLASRHSEIMQILAQLQLNQLRSSKRDKSNNNNNNSNNNNSEEAWVSFKTFLSECKGRFVVSKESVLRSMQSELKDHRLIVSKTESNTEYVMVPFSVDKLKEIIAYTRGDQ